MEPQESGRITKRAEDLVALVAATFPDADEGGEVSQWFEVGEWQISVQMLCEYFWGLHAGMVPASMYDELVALAQILKVEPLHWQRLTASTETRAAVGP